MYLNELSQEEFVERFGSLYEHSSWIAERAYASGLKREHNDPDKLCERFRHVLEAASREEQLSLIRAHPDLVGKAAVAGELTNESTYEQSSAGLDQCSDAEFARFNQLNEAYKDKFEFPFIMAVRKSDRSEILAAFEQRFLNSMDAEFDRALHEIHIIARLRLDALFNRL